MQYKVHTWMTEYLELYLGLLPLLLLCFMIFWRSFHRVLPAFAIYVIYLCITSVLQIVVPTDVITNRIGLAMGATEALIQVFLIYSILRHLCRPFPRFFKLSNWLFVVALLTLVGLAFLSIWRMRSDPSLAQGGVHGASMLGWTLVVCGLVLFVLVVKYSFALPADNPLLLIAVGLGLVEAFDLVISPIFMYYGFHHLLLLYGYEAISGGAAAMEIALWFLAVLHHGEEPVPGKQMDLESSRKQMNDISSAFARLVYKQ
jgi:hypothetical protein